MGMGKYSGKGLNRGKRGGHTQLHRGKGRNDHWIRDDSQ